MEKREQRFLIKYFWMETKVSKKIHQELVTAVGADAYGRSQVKIWVQKFGNGNLSFKEAPRTRRRPCTLRPQLVAFLQKQHFASARVLGQHFLTSVPMIREILQRELGLKKFSRR
jgi:hypothetical protein